MLYSRFAPTGEVISIVPVGDAQVGCTVADAAGVAGKAFGAVVTKLLTRLPQLPFDCVTVNVPAFVTVLGLPVPPSLQVSVPVTPLAVIVELPQLLTTVSTGVAGTGKGAVVTALLATLGQMPTVCVTV